MVVVMLISMLTNLWRCKLNWCKKALGIDGIA